MGSFNRVLSVIVAFIFLLPIVSFASTGSLAVYSGTIISNNPDFSPKVMVEFPFSLNRSELAFFRGDSTDAGLYGRVFAQVDLLSAVGIVVDSVRTYFSVTVNSEEEAKIKDYRIFNKLSMMVKPGLYSARLTVIDVASKSQGEFFFDKIDVVPPDTLNISIGASTLAYNIKFVGEEGKTSNPIMYKNGFEVLSNPINVVAEGDTIVYLYGEIYNLNYDPDVESKYLVSVTVLNNLDGLYSRLGSRSSKKPGKSAVISEKIDISSWPLGHYKFELVATDIQTRTADTVYIPLHIVSPEAVMIAAQEELFFEDPYDTLSLHHKTQLVTYLLNEDEKKTLNALNDEGKSNFLDQYWKEHDENPSTPMIENRFVMLANYNYTNKYFSNNDIKTNGWNTDRARVYLVYGPWDDRDDIQTPRVGNPYVVWYYTSIKQGNVFIFEDWSGNEDYRLVHSDVLGEAYNRDWAERLKEGFINFME